MDPVLLISPAVGLLALAVLVMNVVPYFRPGSTPAVAPSPSPSLSPVSLPIALPVAGTAGGPSALAAILADPLVQAVLLDLLAAGQAEAATLTLDPTLRNLEALAFGVVIDRVKALAAASPASPAAKP